MKVLKLAVIAVVLGGITLLALGCPGGTPTESTPEQQIVTVQRGDLTVDITASGNLSLSRTEDLAFDMAGTVEEVLVEEGESVTEGQLLAKLDTSDWDNQLITLRRNLLQAQINQKNAQLSLDKAEDQTVTLVTGDIIFADNYDDEEIEIMKLQEQLAEARVDDAQQALDDALNASPEVTAPFDGFITRVNVEGGDDILKGTVAVTIADPDRFEADILVSEMDIFQVKVGGDATVQVDAMTALTLPATVTHISPTATIQSGVVNYDVKVELEPLEELMQERQEAMASSGFTPPEGFTPPTQAEQPAAFGDFQLREGLTVTVSIIMQQKSDALLVPNGAITTQGQQAYVQVVAADGSLEERAITTGISNWQYTEVTEGLSEGEQVVVSQGTTSTTTQQGGNRVFIPGVGGPPR
jgi:RND family efflux transporter MFP subunit